MGADSEQGKKEAEIFALMLDALQRHQCNCLSIGPVCDSEPIHVEAFATELYDAGFHAGVESVSVNVAAMKKVQEPAVLLSDDADSYQMGWNSAIETIAASLSLQGRNQEK
jgi:hypothetical protein